MQKVLFFSCTFPLPLSHHEIVLVGDHLIRNKCFSQGGQQVLWQNQQTEDLKKTGNGSSFTMSFSRVLGNGFLLKRYIGKPWSLEEEGQFHFRSCTFPLPKSHHEIVLVVDHLTRNKCCSYRRWQVLGQHQEK